MTLRVCLCVSLLLSTATVCLPYRFLQSGPRSSIVGGEDAPLGRWPWMVYQYITDGRDFRSCGGSLVSKQWVLTAAHCILKICTVEAVKCSHSYVRLGELKLLYATGVRHTIHRYLLHPNYHFHKKVPLHDIAMLKLAKPVHDSKTVAPVPLPGRKDIFSTDSECWVTGWGYVAYNEPLGGDETLQQVQLPLVNDTICRKTYPGTTNNHLCAGYLEGGKDACMGDSGGPLVCKSFEVFVQVGVVSYGVGCGDRGYPGVYTRVYNYMQFIEDSMHKYR